MQLATLEQDLKQQQLDQEYYVEEYEKEHERAEYAEQQAQVSAYRIQELTRLLKSKGDDPDEDLPLPGSWQELPDWCDRFFSGRIVLTPAARRGAKSPEFLDVLTKKVPNLGGFQATRGTLRFLAHVVRHTHERRPLVSSQDLPLRDDTVVQALANLDTQGGEVVRRALGDNFDLVPSSLKHKDELFSTIVFYSIADPVHPGATLEEILLATLDPGENPIQLRDSLAQLKQLAYNLHERGDRFVFLAVENPHARVNAMAASQLVTWDAIRDHVLGAVSDGWGAPDLTAIYMPGDGDALARRLVELRARRPRYLLSAAILTPAERLELQNLDEKRNLVLLIEPRFRTSTGAGDDRYRLLSDDVLVLHARRIEACKLLLEGSPAAEAARVYRSVRDTEQEKLRKAIAERYGHYVAWHRAGATGSPVDETWYDLSRLDEFSEKKFRVQLLRDHSSQPDVTEQVKAQWTNFRHRPVASLIEQFEKTPGLPVPVDAKMIPTAVRELARDGLLGLVATDGTLIPRRRLGELDDASIAGCTLGDPRAETTAPGLALEPLPRHTQVQAHYDPTQRGVRITWTYPSPNLGFRTLIQRYTTARGWEEGQAYPLGTDQSFEANRHLGPEDSCLDTERLQPGQLFHYYVFLVKDGGDSGDTFVLSRRCDVSIPQAQAPGAESISTSPQPELGKLVVEVEKLVMSGKHMTSAQRVRKVEVRLSGIIDPKLRAAFGGELVERAGNALEISGDLMFVMRGEFDRQAVLGLLRALPRLDGATYTATLHLKQPTVA